jgi:hypothetical protein
MEPLEHLELASAGMFERPSFCDEDLTTPWIGSKPPLAQAGFALISSDYPLLPTALPAIALSSVARTLLVYSNQSVMFAVSL